MPSGLVLHQSHSGMEGRGPCISPKGTTVPGSGYQGVWGAEPIIPELLILQPLGRVLEFRSLLSTSVCATAESVVVRPFLVVMGPFCEQIY